MTKQIFPIGGIQVAEATVHLHFTKAVDHEDVANFVHKALSEARLAGEFKSDEATLLLGLGQVGVSWFDTEMADQPLEPFTLHAVFSEKGVVLGTHDEPCELDSIQSVPMVLKSKFDELDAKFYAAEDQILGLQQELERKEAVILQLQESVDLKVIGRMQQVINDMKAGVLGRYNAEGLLHVIEHLRSDTAGGRCATMTDLDLAADALEHMVSLSKGADHV